MKAPRYCECGREIKVFLHARNSSKAQGVKLVKHDMCDPCWRALVTSANQKEKV